MNLDFYLLIKNKTAPFSGCCFVCFGADEQIRTAYLLITNEVLYRLSYISARNEHYSEASRSLQVLISLKPNLTPPRG